jgi:hypothetical protein
MKLPNPGPKKLQGLRCNQPGQPPYQTPTVQPSRPWRATANTDITTLRWPPVTTPTAQDGDVTHCAIPRTKPATYLPCQHQSHDGWLLSCTFQATSRLESTQRSAPRCPPSHCHQQSRRADMSSYIAVDPALYDIDTIMATSLGPGSITVTTSWSNSPAVGLDQRSP